MPPAFEVLLLNTAIPQIQAAQSGDTYVVPRDIAFSAALTLSAGTANGVPYLNASKVLTTGSALTFDGTNLQVGGNSQPIIRAVSSSTNNATARLFTDGDTVYMGSLNTSTTGGSVPVVFQIGGSEQMRLTSTGLGIGTSSPLARLSVQLPTTSPAGYTAAANSGITLDCGTSTNGVINLVGGGDLGIFHSNSSNAYDVGIGFGNNTDRILVFTTANTERARITSGGDLYINTQTAIDAAYKVQLYFASGGGISIKTGTDGDNAMGFRNSSGTSVGSIVINTAGTAYNTSSDYRLKDNQQPLTGSGAFIDALKPKTWDWKSGGKGVGFIAHEVAEVSPGTVVGEKDAVDTDGKPIMQAMEYGSAEFIANIVAELQSLRARVAQLEQGA